MPSPRLRVRRRRECVTAKHWLALGRGPKWFDPWAALNNVDYRDLQAIETILADIRRVWDAVKKSLLAHWIRHSPGTRPWAWYMFDAPEIHRRVLKGPGYSLLTANDEFAEARRRVCIRFGVSGSLSVQDMQNPSVCESEWAYLQRLDLLTKEEKRIPASEFPTTNEDEAWHRDEDWLPPNLL